jgi:hypothetical protein
MWAHEEGSQPEHKAIEHGEIRRTLSGAIANQQWMLEQERLSCDAARATSDYELCFRPWSRPSDRPALGRSTERMGAMSLILSRSCQFIDLQRFKILGRDMTPIVMIGTLLLPRWLSATANIA